MLHRTYDAQNCSIARALEIVGDRWTLLVIRDAFDGVRRFDDFQANLGVARNVLTDRLNRLCDEGILRRHRYQERPERFEYRLTRKGVGLWPAMMSLMMWGDQYYAEDGPPLVLFHRGCPGRLTPGFTCSECGASLGPTDVDPRPGPGADPADPAGRVAESGGAGPPAAGVGNAAAVRHRPERPGAGRGDGSANVRAERAAR